MPSSSVWIPLLTDMSSDEIVLLFATGDPSTAKHKQAVEYVRWVLDLAPGKLTPGSRPHKVFLCFQRMTAAASGDFSSFKSPSIKAKTSAGSGASGGSASSSGAGLSCTYCPGKNTHSTKDCTSEEAGKAQSLEMFKAFMFKQDVKARLNILKDAYYREHG